MVRGRRKRLVASQLAMETVCCHNAKHQNDHFNVGDFKMCDRSSPTIATDVQTTIATTKRSARIAKRHNHHHQAITNYFQVQAKRPTSHGQSDGMDTTDDSDPSPPIQDDDDNACDYPIAFGQHFQPMIRESFSINTKQNVTTKQTAHGSCLTSNSANAGKQYDGVEDADDDDDDSSSNSSIEPNIFLQEPVLHLNVDKSLNQPSSIVIKKHLEIGPNFASALKSVTNSKITANRARATATTTIMERDLYRNMEKIGARKGSLIKHKTKRKLKSKIDASYIIDAMHSSDSNSCDSGVVADRTPDAGSAMGKPTTPHRIVCTSTTGTKMTIQRYTQKAITNFANINFRRNGQTEAAEIDAVPTITNDFKSKRRLIDAANDKIPIKTTPPPTLPLAHEYSTEITSEKNVAIENTTKHIEENFVKITARPLSPNHHIDKKVASQPPKRLTDFFPVRRSVRKTKRAVEQENLRHIERAIERKSEDGLVVQIFKEKGRGIIAGRPFARGEFVVEYIGDLIDQAEADRREQIYARDAKFGCYMYYFKHKEQQWCIDATSETGNLGRLVNHSRNGNLSTKIVTYKGRPHLVLLAKEDIKEGEELTYDYGDRTRESLINHPWLAL